ncbi:hypothetical protein [Azomonas macrocytogenes]|uniref:Uncharacterized protein n=1 Tax=Azomonas macrocytogenes TaxID=69962 RepID=A0A839T7D4_AZOMA|nr:hypothetical protein [Azomonas macrocytogenes]MBB3104164.1 hypothetical protein [Azomonas macrocytogenes]
MKILQHLSAKAVIATLLQPVPVALFLLDGIVDPFLGKVEDLGDSNKYPVPSGSRLQTGHLEHFGCCKMLLS